MAVEQHIPGTDEQADIVTYELFINGNKIEDFLPLSEIVIEKEVNKIPSATIKISDGDVAEETFPYSDQDLFVPGNLIEIKLGYQDNNHTLFKGMITAHGNRVNSRTSLLIISCKDIVERMTSSKKYRHFEEITDSDIEEDLIGTYGFDKEIESTSIVHEEAIQFNISDWDFILSRADVMGRICLVEDGKIVIRKPDLQKETILDVAFGSTLIEYDAVIDARKQTKDVAAFGWSYAEQNVVVEESEKAAINIAGNLEESDLADVTSMEAYKLKSGVSVAQDVLREWASAKRMKNNLAKIKGKVKFQGFPEVKPGAFINLQGVGKRFSGALFVSKVKHVFSDGNWITEAELGMDDKWYAENINPYNLSAQLGQFPGMQGLQIGIVTDLEDPLGAYRIKVRLPIISNEEEGVWMRMTSLDAGNNRGLFVRPEIGDEVIVGFVFNDPNQPVVLGMLHSSKNEAPAKPSNDNHEKIYHSRSGVKISLNDEKKSYTIQTPGNRMVTLDDNAGKILIKDKAGNFIKMDKDGITINSIKDIVVKAKEEIKVESKTNVSKIEEQVSVETGNSTFKIDQASIKLSSIHTEMESLASAKVKSNILSIEGASVIDINSLVLQMKAKGAAIIKGAIVSIN